MFGWLSDKIGRKWIMMGGMLLGMLTYRPIYQNILDRTDASQKTEIAESRKVEIKATPIKNSTDSLRKTITYRSYTDGAVYKETKTDTAYATSDRHTIKPDVKMEKKVGGTDYKWLALLIFLQILYVTMVYGPIAAFLVELFPTRIRYTSMSLPYHIGNGVFGGLVPFISTLIIEYTKTAENPKGDPLAGLWYPIAIAAVCLVIGTIYLASKENEHVNDDTNAYIS